jgi:large subunit ribosomal protein L13
MNEVILDVQGKKLGRAASEAAVILRGKNRATFQPHIVPDLRLKVTGVAKLSITDRKMEGKEYTRYTGYPGGLRKVSLANLWAKDPSEVFKKAVWGMLPKNKLRTKFIKNLIIEK